MPVAGAIDSACSSVYGRFACACGAGSSQMVAHSTSMRQRDRQWASAAMRTIVHVLTIAQAADRVGRNPETIRRWIRSGRLPARRVGQHHAIEDRDLRMIEDALFPMAELPDEWQVGDDGSPAPNWVAALHRSRSGH